MVASWFSRLRNRLLGPIHIKSFQEREGIRRYREMLCPRCEMSMHHLPEAPGWCGGKWCDHCKIEWYHDTNLTGDRLTIRKQGL